METLILGRADVAQVMDLSDWLKAAETAFLAASERRATSPPPMHIEGEGGGFHAKGASLRLDRPYVAVKLNGNFPGNPAARGLPTIQGAILLCDGEDGRLLAILDSIEVTLRRTAAATALAARYLARPDSASILVCGCGEQGRAQLDALGSALPLSRAFAWDRDAAKAEAFAEATGAEVAPRLGEAARASDVIVTCTTATEPYLSRKMVSPGAFVAAVGADSPAKNELAPGLFEGTTIVADMLDQCLAMGDLRHAVAAGVKPEVHAELAELVGGLKPGRQSDDEITLFDSTGAAIQDVAAAALIYQKCAGHASVRRIDLGSL